jgi:hypothetical protein
MLRQRVVVLCALLVACGGGGLDEGNSSAIDSVGRGGADNSAKSLFRQPRQRAFRESAER